MSSSCGFWGLTEFIMTMRNALSDLPGVLATWIRERDFDICPWQHAPPRTAKIPERDAWQFDTVVLVRVPILAANHRYYATICQGPVFGKAVGYWLEVRKTGTPAE
jgi:hypothetical protein